DATISLLKSKDSSLQQMGKSDAAGRFHFFIKKKGLYRLQASHIGFRTTYSNIFTFGESSPKIETRLVCPFYAGDLKGVTIEVQKPLVEVLADRLVVNVENSVQASTNALEVLRRSPGITLDNEDHISLGGKNGVLVFIDGNASPLNGAELTSYLSTLPASAIESIEIITLPSASYEAAGNAGIINIRLKKNKSFGTSGTVTQGWGIGTFPKYNVGFTINYRNHKFNIFSSYNFHQNKNLVNTHIYRILLDSLFDQHINRTIIDKGHSVKAGTDYILNKTSTIGAVVLLNPSENFSNQQSLTDISFQPDRSKGNSLTALNEDHSTRWNTDMNLNFRYLKGDNSINIDADHGFYHLDNVQWQPNDYFSARGDFLYNHTYSINAPSSIQLSTLKIHYSGKIKQGKLELGGKFSDVSNGNRLLYYNVLNNQNQPDSSRTNHYAYQERIGALYANFNKASKNFTFQLGLRMEHTAVLGLSEGFIWKGKYVPDDSSLKHSYNDLFPSFSITYHKSKVHQLSLNYSKRIDRPAYQDLNPFEFRIDEYSFRKGNTQLRPQYTNSFGVVYVYKSSFTANLNYSRIQSVMTLIYDTLAGAKSFQSKRNLEVQKITSLNLSYNIQYGRYTSMINLNSFYSSYKAYLGWDRQLDNQIFSTNAQLQQQLKLGKTWTSELAFYYSSPSIWQGTFKSKTITSLEMGMQKTFLKDKLVAKASLWDFIFIYNYHGTSNFAGQYLDIEKNWEPHLLEFNLSYRIGNTQVKNRQRKTGLEEDASRLQGEAAGN
ncbi:MAG: TonB-dependent receptor domain-containing protein, partial [Flavisolibacter sp.]